MVRVDQGLSPEELTIEGSNIESNVLAVTVKFVAERKVLLNGHKIVVFNLSLGEVGTTGNGKAL